MKKPLIVRPEAEADLNGAYQWYEDRVRGLGAEFLQCVDTVMTLIEKNPQLYPVVHKGVVRRTLTRRFPYGVFFVEDERSISVIGVIHAKRSHRVWQDRV